MINISGKKLLILGGKPIGSCEIVRRAKELGVYTIVTDYLSYKDSPAKQIADESWDISTADITLLAEQCKISKVDGVYAGVHEFNIRQAIKLCELMRYPCYCTLEQWDGLENKGNFKRECEKHGIPITKCFSSENGDFLGIADSDYPVITKPADGSGSRGFSICNSLEELKQAYKYALRFSDTDSVLIEQLMDYRYSVIINYTIVNGTVIYSGMSDKRSKKVFDNGAPIMSFQFYPSEHEKLFLDTLNDKTIEMLQDMNLQNGVIWIEAFYNNTSFIYNELGYRFGGSLTYYPVKYLYNIDQLTMQIEYALCGANNADIKNKQSTKDEVYCILPVHVKAGKIKKIIGIESLKSKNYYREYVPVHFEGDCIDNWGSAQQVLAYIHFIAKNRVDSERIVKDIMNTLYVYDNFNSNMLFNLFDDTCI